MPHIVVVGGGISGLAAALRVRELAPAAQLSLLEAGDRLGGVLSTIRRDGFLIEQSADNFLAEPRDAVDFCGQIGLESELIDTEPTKRRAFVVRGGGLHPVPEGFRLLAPARTWPLLTTRLLSWQAKVRLVRERWAPPRPADAAEETLAEFAVRRLGREAYDYLVQPLVGGIYAGDAEKLSVAATMPRFVEMEQQHGSLTRGVRAVARANAANGNRSGDSGARYSLFLAPRDGMQTIVDAAAARLSDDAIRYGAPVDLLSPTSDGWELLLGDPPETIQAEAVILATPARVAANILSAVAPQAAVELAGIEMAGSVVVSLGVRRDQVRLPDGFGVVVPAVEERRIIAASFASEKFPGRTPEGHVLVRVFLGGSLQPQMCELDDEQLATVAREELEDLVAFRGEPVLTHISRWPDAMPQYHVGHAARVARIEAELDRLKRLEICGNAYQGVGIPQCISSGRQAAAEIVGSLNQ